MQFNLSDLNLLSLAAFLPLIPALMRFRKDRTGRIRLLLVSLMCLSLFLGISGIFRFPGSSGTCHIFLIDRSGSSLLFQKNIRSRFQNKLEELRSADTGRSIGLLVFFADGYSVAGEPVPLEELQWPGPGFSYPDSSATDLQKALDTSLSLVPEGYIPSVWIFGDGTSGSSGLFLPGNIPSEYFRISHPVPDAALTEFTCPEETPVGSTVQFRVSVFTESPAQGIVRLIEALSGDILNTYPASFQGGEQLIDLDAVFTTPGYKAVLAEVEIEGDSVQENNVLKRFIQVSTTEEPHYLVIGNPLPGLAGALTVAPGDLDDFTLERLAPFSAAVINDVTYPELGSSHATLLQRYVLEAGGGLVIAGTSRVFGLGDYGKTPFEEILPLSSEPRMPERTKRRIMIAVDTSGSMDEELPGGRGKKINGAKAAAMGFVLEREQEKDTEIGLIFFSSEINTVKVPGDRISEDVLKDRLRTVTPHGGTKIIPALRTCIDVLKKNVSDDEDRFIFLLTDGITREEMEGELVDAIAGDISKYGIGLLVLNIGDAKEKDLEQITERAGGRYAKMKSDEDITVSFSRETDREMSDLLVTETCRLVPGPGAAAAGIRLPAETFCSRYIRTTLQKGALGILFTEEKKDPVAALKFSGAGRTAALAGNLPENGSSLLSSLITWAGRNRGMNTNQTRFRRKGETVAVEFISDKPLPPGTAVSCRIFRDRESSSEFVMNRTSETSFASDIPCSRIPSEFSYSIMLNGSAGDSGMFVADYPAEYNPLLSRRVVLMYGRDMAFPRSGGRSYVPFLIVFLGLFTGFEIYSVLVLRRQ